MDLGSRQQTLAFFLGPRIKNWRPLHFLSLSLLCVTLLIGSITWSKMIVTSIPSTILVGTGDKLVTCEQGIVHHICLQPPTVPSPIRLHLLQDVAIAAKIVTKMAARVAMGLNSSPFRNFKVKWILDCLSWKLWSNHYLELVPGAAPQTLLWCCPYPCWLFCAFRKVQVAIWSKIQLQW